MPDSLIEETESGFRMHGTEYFSSTDQHVKWLTKILPNTQEPHIETNIFCGDDAGVKIAEALSKNTSLGCLRFYTGLMTDRSAQAFAEALEGHPTLEDFTFSGQLITAKGAAEIICKAKVTSLNLSNNQITDENFELLCEAIKINKNLKRLHLNPLSISPANIGLLKKALQENGRISDCYWGQEVSEWRKIHRKELHQIEIICALNYCRTESVDQVFESFPYILKDHLNDESVLTSVCSALNANLGLHPLSRLLTPKDLIALFQSLMSLQEKGDMVWLYTRGPAVKDVTDEEYPILAYRNGHLAQDKTLRERLLEPQCSMTELCETLLED